MACQSERKEKTFMIFSLSNEEHSVHLKLNGQTLNQEDTPTYLGVTLDRRLTWKNQLHKNQARTKIRLALMKKLSCTEWGADQNVLEKLYVYEYGWCDIWFWEKESWFWYIVQTQNILICFE